MNMVETARILRIDLRKIADEAFADELKWYEEKLNVVKGEE
jgi:hypothetical protein